MIHRPLKNTGCQILRVMKVSCPIVHIIEYALHVALVKLTERIPVTLRSE
jgi:hypothetical protein